MTRASRLRGVLAAASMSVLVGGSGALVGCRPAADVAITTRVSVTITPKVDTLPFDPRSARITQAANELADLVGHPLTIDIDAAMVPEFRSSFEEALARSFENITRDFTDTKKRRPLVFAFAAPLFEHVSVRYDATKRRDETTFDPETRALRIEGPATREDLVPRGVVAFAAERAYADQATDRFARKTADAVPPSDRRAYFDHLTGRSFKSEESADVAGLASSPKAARVLEILRLHELAKGNDAELTQRSEAWLVSAQSWFVESYVHRPALVRQLPADCTFRRAELAYGRFLLGAYAAASDEDKLQIERSLFVRSFNGDRAAQDGRSYPPFAWPAVDRFAFGLGVIDAWRAAGHPSSVSPRRVSQAQEFMACPHVMQGQTHIVARCDYDFYRFALETAEGRKRLASALVERSDPVFAATAFAAFPSAGDRGTDTLLTMLRAVEGNPTVYRAGVRVLAARSDNAQDRTLLEEAQRVWLQRPEHRGVVLSLLVHLDRYDHGNVDWRGFEDAFGGKVSRDELSSYLEEGPLALALLPIAWPALGRYPRADLIVPRLDPLLDEGTRSQAGVSAYGALADVVGRLCAEKSTADLAAVRAYLDDRVKRHPGEPYAKIADQATSETCKPAPPGPPPRNEVRLLSGKKRLRIIQGGTDL